MDAVLTSSSSHHSHHHSHHQQQQQQSSSSPVKQEVVDSWHHFFIHEILLTILQNDALFTIHHPSPTSTKNHQQQQQLFAQLFQFASKMHLFQWNLPIVKQFLIQSRVLPLLVENNDKNNSSKASKAMKAMKTSKTSISLTTNQISRYIVREWNSRNTVKRTSTVSIMFSVIVDCLDRSLIDRASFFYGECVRYMSNSERTTKSHDNNRDDDDDEKQPLSVSSPVFSSFQYCFMICKLLKSDVAVIHVDGTGTGSEEVNGDSVGSKCDHGRLQLAQQWIHNSHLAHITYSPKELMHLLSACVSAQLLNDAMNILNRLIEMTMTETTTNHMGEAMDEKKLLQLNDTVETKNVEISAAIYGLLLESLKRNLDLNPRQYKPYVHRIVTHLKKNRVSDASERMHQAAIAALAAVEDVRGIRLYMEKMKEVYGQEPTIRMINSIVGVKCKTRSFSQVRKFVADMKQQYGVSPDVYTYNMLLDRAKSFPELHLALGDMSMNRVSMDRVSFNTLIKVLCQCNMQKKALFYYSQMKDSLGKDFIPDFVTVLTLIRSCKDSPDIVYKLYNDVMNYKIPMKDDLPALLVNHCPEYRETLVSAILTKRERFLHAQPRLAFKTLIDVCRDSLPGKQVEALEVALRSLSIPFD